MNEDGKLSNNKKVKIVVVALVLIIALIAGFKLKESAASQEKILDEYQLTAEDAEEWNSAAEYIVQIINEIQPYYIASNRTELSAEESEKWQSKSEKFIKKYLLEEDMYPDNARDYAGLNYIKSTVIYLINEGDIDSNGYGYLIHDKLSNLNVKHLSEVPGNNQNTRGMQENTTATADYNLIVDVNGCISEFSTTGVLTNSLRGKTYELLPTALPDFFSKSDEPLLRYSLIEVLFSLRTIPLASQADAYAEVLNKYDLSKEWEESDPTFLISDLDSNGVYELIVGSNMNHDSTDLYTLDDNDNVIHLGSFGHFTVPKDGRNCIFTYDIDDANVTVTEYAIKNEKLEELISFKTHKEGDEYVIDFLSIGGDLTARELDTTTDDWMKQFTQGDIITYSCRDYAKELTEQNYALFQVIPERFVLDENTDTPVYFQLPFVSGNSRLFVEK